MTLKASCMTANLIREIAAVSKAASTRSSLPILHNVLIETTDGGLYVTATNLTSFLRAFVPGKVTEEGRTTVTPADLTHLLSQFGKETKTDLLQDGDYLLVADGEGTSGRLRTIDAEEMPVRVDSSKWPLVAKIDAQALGSMIERAIPFCAHDEARPILTGICVQTSPDKVTFGAADNYCLTELDTDLVAKGKESKTVIPATALKLLVGLLEKTEETVVEYRAEGARANFSFGTYDLTIACIDGQYPNYESVIPRYSPFDGETGSYGITVDRKALVKALKLARRGDTVIHVVTGPDSVAVIVPGERRTIATPDGAMIGRAEAEALFAKTLPATILPTRDEKIGFNPEILTRVLNATMAPTITLFRNDADVNHAYGVDTGDPSSRYAVMPVKLA